RTARPVVLPPAAGLRRCLTPGVDLLARAVAVVRPTIGNQLRRHGTMSIKPLRLEIRAMVAADRRTFVPVQTEPAQAVENPLNHRVGRSFRVGVFDAEDEHAARPPCIEPVEERSARPTDMQVAGWRWSEANADRHEV